MSVHLQGFHAEKSLCLQPPVERQRVGQAMETEFPSHPPKVVSSTRKVNALRREKKLAVLLPGSDVLCW